MPSTIEIQDEARPIGGPASVLFKYMQNFQNLTNRNLIVYYSGFLRVRENVDIQDADMDGFMAAIYKMDKAKGLDLFLHTPGGSVTATEGIGNYLRSVFHNDVECYVPHMAMSCGTLLSMACKQIYMGRQSCLGPIDPALGSYRTDAVVEEFEKAKKDIAKDPNLSLLWQPIISKYPMTFLGECEKASELAGIVSTKWLKSGMLKGDVHQRKKLSAVQNLFASHKISKTHDRHISADEAMATGLKVQLIEGNPSLQDAVMSVHHAAINFMNQEGHARLITNVNGKGLFVPIASK